MSRAVRLFPDAARLAEEAADEIARRIERALGSDPEARFSIGLAGGKTPRPVYERLAEMHGGRIAWGRVDIFWSDERYVPHTAPESNYRMAREALLDRVAIPEANIHPIPTSRPDPAEAAREYEMLLAAFFQSPFPKLDLSILGIGDDGHTASLFPGAPTLGDRDHAVVVAHAPAEPSTRITFTLPALESARATLFLVAGAAKRPIFQSIIDTPEEAARRYPAAMVKPEGEVVWMWG